MGKPPEMLNNDIEINRKVSIDYTLAAAQTFEQRFSSYEKKFRFIYLSGAAAEKDQEKSLWIMQDYRRIPVRVSFQVSNTSTTHTPKIFNV